MTTAFTTKTSHQISVDLGGYTNEDLALYLKNMRDELDRREALHAKRLEEEAALRAGYLEEPERWVEERLKESLWKGERAILRSVAKHRRTLVKSCHEVGKSFTAARVACWWLDNHNPGEAFVVTSAPTAYQVKSVLWREIGRAHKKAELMGRLNLTEWWATLDGREELVAFGRKPDEYDIAAFQGIHAPYVLVILDEACGIHGPLWEAADSLIANDNSKSLVIGNPDDPKSEFRENAKPGSGYNVVSISAFDSPNFTGEEMPAIVLQQLIGRTYVEEKRAKWAPSWYWVNAQGERCDVEEGVRVVPPNGATPDDAKAWEEALKQVNPFWCSKVLGEFPPVGSEASLIPLSWIIAAQQRTLQPIGPNTLGVDVGAGGDSSDICHRRGPVYRIVHEDTNPDTMQTVGNVIHWLDETGAEEARVDTIGIGKGVVDRLREQGKPVVGVNVGWKASEENQEYYENLKAEAYWEMREDFEKGNADIDPMDEELAAQLADIRFARTSKGRIKIESKEDAKKRGVASPNRAEALMLSRVQVPEEEGGVLSGKAVW